MRQQFTRLNYLRKVISALDDDLSKDWRDYPCIEWPFYINHNGYGYIHTKSKPKTEGIFAHRVACEFAWGELPEGIFALHRCDNRKCFRPIHTFKGTLADNIHDCIAKGRSKRKDPRPTVCGEGNHKAKLTAEQVISMRLEHAESWASVNELAKRYGVASQTIWAAIKRKTWTRI